MEEIRKIAVGADYKNAMHYIVGQVVLNGTATIEHICRTKKSSIEIWIKNKDGVMKWKEFTSQMPTSIEFNIEFN